MAWYKVYYPREFYATYFGSVVSDFDADTILKGREAIIEKMDLINAKGLEATAKENNELTVLEVAYEMYARGYEFKDMVLGETAAEPGFQKYLMERCCFRSWLFQAWERRRPGLWQMNIT